MVCASELDARLTHIFVFQCLCFHTTALQHANESGACAWSAPHKCSVNSPLSNSENSLLLAAGVWLDIFLKSFKTIPYAPFSFTGKYIKKSQLIGRKTTTEYEMCALWLENLLESEILGSCGLVLKAPIRKKKYLRRSRIFHIYAKIKIKFMKICFHLIWNIYHACQ